MRSPVRLAELHGGSEEGNGCRVGLVTRQIVKWPGYSNVSLSFYFAKQAPVEGALLRIFNSAKIGTQSDSKLSSQRVRLNLEGFTCLPSVGLFILQTPSVIAFITLCFPRRKTLLASCGPPHISDSYCK